MSERRDPLNRQGRVRRTARSILGGLASKDRHEPLMADLLDPAAEALDLFYQGFDQRERGGDRSHRRCRDEVGTEPRHVSALPLHSSRARVRRRLESVTNAIGRLASFAAAGGGSSPYF